MTLFKAFYGRDPLSIPDYTTGSTNEDVLDLNLQKIQNILTQLKSNFEKSKVTMEKQPNTKRVYFTFKVGDLVLLKLQPYRQTTVAKRLSHKFSKRIFGLIPVIKRIDNVAYLLDLPSSSRIHPVVHVSLLR